jgi:hypothetical protein
MRLCGVMSQLPDVLGRLIGKSSRMVTPGSQDVKLGRPALGCAQLEGLVYSFDTTSDALIAHVRRWEKISQPSRVVGGVDLGYTIPAVALVVGIDGDDRLWLLDEWAKRRASLEGEIIPAILGLTRQYRVAVWYCDTEDPEAIARLDAALVDENLACRAVAVKKGPGTVRAGIQTVTRLLAMRGEGTRGLYVDPRCALLVAEMEQYAYASAGSGTGDPRVEPIKQNDSALDALLDARVAS